MTDRSHEPYLSMNPSIHPAKFASGIMPSTIPAAQHATHHGPLVQVRCAACSVLLDKESLSLASILLCSLFFVFFCPMLIPTSTKLKRALMGVILSHPDPAISSAPTHSRRAQPRALASTRALRFFLRPKPCERPRGGERAVDSTVSRALDPESACGPDSDSAGAVARCWLEYAAANDGESGGLDW